jgi:two-component system LytT family response regulator
MTIHALIADDEALSRRVLRQLLARHADVVVTAECSNGAETIAAIATPGLDVAFLDVCMPLASGLDVACGGVRPLVVFVTAFDDFAARAFDVDAVDYLLKPIDDDRFDAAVDRVRERVRLRRLDAARAEAVTGSSARTTPPYLRQLVARVGQREIIVPLDDVELLRADDVYVDVHAKGRRHVVRTSLDALERVLDPAQFLRVHRSFIVPIARMRETRRRNGVEVVLDTGMVVPVSRRRRARLDALLGRPYAR